MSTKKTSVEYIFTAQTQKLVRGMSAAQRGMTAFNKSVGAGNSVVDGLRNQVLGLAGAFVGLQAISSVNQLLLDASAAGYNLEASLMAANRQFDVGNLSEWEATLGRLSSKLRIYSETELKGAAARTVDMTKRLGLSQEQMELLIERTADLSTGKTNLEDGIERVTAALRGEAEASEYLGLTLNETFVKGWYEARGAMEGAWKDLDDLTKAQIRYQVFLEQAGPLAGKAADSITTYGGAIKYVHTVISDHIAKNQELVESLKQVATVLRDNAGELGQAAAGVATLAAKVIEFVANNHEMIATVIKWGVVLGAAGKAVQILVSLWRGLNAAMLASVGMRVVPFIQAIGTTAMASVAGVASLTTALAGVALATGGFLAAYKVGEWLTMRESMAGIAEETARLGRYTEALKNKFSEISAATGVTVNSMEELDEAVKAGKLHYDDLSGTWKKGAAEMTAATKKSADAQKTVQGKALEDMKKQYKKYADQIKKIQDDIAGREMSLAEQLREMARTGMTDLGAWRDRKKEAQEYERAAKKAAEVGKFDEAVQLADRARAAYADLNEEVKAGDRVLISQQQALQTSMAGVRQAGELAIDILRQQEEAISSAADELNQQSGGQLGEAFTRATEQAKDLNQVIQESGGDWGKVWQKMEQDAERAIQDTEQRIVKLTRDREVTVYVNEVVRRASGGVISKLATGGKLGGYGGGDRIPALLEAGEFVIRKEAVRRFGAGLFHALNNMHMPWTGFNTGGTVPKAAGPVGGTGGEVTLNLALPGGQVVPTTITRDYLQALQRALNQYQVSLS